MAPPKVSAAQIQQVRAKVLEIYESSKDTFDESDIERVRTEDVFITRYLTREQLDVEQAIETIVSGLRFVKRHGVKSIKESEFSPELLGLCQFAGKDKNGVPMVYIRYKTFKKIVKRNSKDSEKLKRLALYYFNKIENETKGNYTLCVDARSLSIRDLVKYMNKDLAQLAIWLGTAGVRYSPDAIGTLLLFEVPRFFAAVAERIIKLIPDTTSGTIKLVRKKDLEKIVSKDDTPDYMGGKMAAGSKGSAADDEADSGDEEVTNLDEMEKALDEAESSQM